MQGLQALWRAFQNGPSALVQCPLEAILDYDLDALKALRHLLEKETSLLVRKFFSLPSLMRVKSSDQRFATETLVGISQTEDEGVSQKKETKDRD